MQGIKRRKGGRERNADRTRVCVRGKERMRQGKRKRRYDDGDNDSGGDNNDKIMMR